MRLIRVFPRKTKASPDDELAYFGPPDLFAEADKVHVSVAFTQDKPTAERLAEDWKHVAPVEVGGVAYEDESLEFIPGRYLRLAACRGWNEAINNRPVPSTRRIHERNPMKHTPKPWVRGNFGASIVSDSPIESGPLGANDVEYYGGYLICESVAPCNRPLIMAAPELLEAAELQEAAELRWANCEECSEALSFPELCSKCFPLFDDARLKRRAAIAKAKGE